MPPLTLTVNMNPSSRSVGARTLIFFSRCGGSVRIEEELPGFGTVIVTGNISPFATPPEG